MGERREERTALSQQGVYLTDSGTTPRVLIVMACKPYREARIINRTLEYIFLQ
ncbi:hypothetical protein J6590_017514 [Homalodisca vitripennis]|nr:hypothetical protein J6590_017514 [Homalodisca vitripennis]